MKFLGKILGGDFIKSVSNIVDNVVICHNPEEQEKHNILAVPTLIVFDNNVEIARYEANIMMELDISIGDLQDAIDKVYLAKFE